MHRFETVTVWNKVSSSSAEYSAAWTAWLSPLTLVAFVFLVLWRDLDLELRLFLSVDPFWARLFGDLFLPRSLLLLFFGSTLPSAL